MKRVHSHLPEPMLKDLMMLAKKRQRKVAELIRQAIHEYIRRESK